jgi:hypothetical protein
VCFDLKCVMRGVSSGRVRPARKASPGKAALNQLAACCGAAVLIANPAMNVVDVTLKRDHGSFGLGVIMDRIEQGFVVTAWVMIAAAAIYLIW